MRCKSLLRTFRPLHCPSEAVAKRAAPQTRYLAEPHKKQLSVQRAAVHVVLSPGAANTTCEAIRQQCGTVCAMGLHNSDTNALIEYLNEYFDVDVSTNG